MTDIKHIAIFNYLPTTSVSPTLGNFIKIPFKGCDRISIQIDFIQLVSLSPTIINDSIYWC